MPRETPRTRAREIVARLRNAEGVDDLFLEFENLDSLPPDDVRAELEPWLGPAPSLDDLDDAMRKRHGLAPRALVLETVAVVEDADVLDLGAIADKQLRIAGKTWDGADLEPEERLDGELEGTFAGTLRHVVLADARTKTPMFDVIRFHEDQGLVFRTGTLDVVAFIADGVVESRDRNVAAALTEALAPAKPKPTRRAAPKKEASTAKKKTTTKTTTKTSAKTTTKTSAKATTKKPTKTKTKKETE
jgi:hypothetical protein